MPASRSFPLSSANAQATPFYKKHKMSLTQTYYLAHTARSKLSKEAARSEYDLRVLVGHANLLDGLMIELADAEREQESWFNQSLRKAESTTAAAPTAKSSPSHISWADSLPPVAEVEDDSSDEESSDDDEDMIDAEEPVLTRKRAPTPPATYTTAMEVDDDSDSDDIADDDESDSDELTLTRVSSRSTLSSPTEAPLSPPELCDELSESEDEDANTPPSPPTEILHLSSKQREEQLKGAEDWTVVTSQHELYA